MLPHPFPMRGTRARFTDYMRKIIKYPQMDVDYTFWQILYILLDPKRVYKNSSYHKQTKNQWARDDPAFAVVIVCFITVSVVSYSIAFGVSRLTSFLWLWAGAVFVDFILVGCLIATACHFICNKYLRSNGIPHGVEQRVEWLYAFDVHCNSFMPVLMLLYGVQYILLPVVLSHSIVSIIVANGLYILAFCYYNYITFLGYNALPFLHEPRLFLYPISVILLVGALATVFGFNASRFTLGIYFPNGGSPATTPGTVLAETIVETTLAAVTSIMGAVEASPTEIILTTFAATTDSNLTELASTILSSANPATSFAL